MNIKRSGLKSIGASFSGHRKFLDKKGEVLNSFYYLYDPQKYMCQVEIYNIDIDSENGNVRLLEESGHPAMLLDVPADGISVKLPDDKILSNSEEGFAYRFKLTELDADGNPIPGNVSYAFDNGSVLGIENKDENSADEKYNLIFSGRALINKNGPMQLIMPDEYYPGIENAKGRPKLNLSLRAQALASVRTHANKLGGNFYGIIERLPEIKKEGISRIVGTPFTKDTISSHLYWTENAYQTAPDLGSVEDFKELQRKLFSNGISWIADAALVNEGLGGIHLDAVLRNGDKSYAANMFRLSKGQKVLGVLPAPSKNEKDGAVQHTKMKLINAPYIVEKYNFTKNPYYDSSKPVYIQLYDDRLASEDQVNSNSPADMKTYKNKNTENIYDITKHDDAVYPFAFEVNPDELTKNLEKAAKTGSIEFSKSIPYEEITEIANFSNFKISAKSRSGGIELWDGNVDIAKLNFYLSPNDYVSIDSVKGENESALHKISALEKGVLAVKDYDINSGRYWTKLTADTQLEFAASKLEGGDKSAAGYKNKINRLIKQGVFPESAGEADEEMIQNALSGNYNLRKMKEEPAGIGDYILKNSMNLPIETLPAANNLMSILSSPYIIQRPVINEHLGKTRYELYQLGKSYPDKEYSDTQTRMHKIYSNIIMPQIMELVSGISGISENGAVTEYGRYVLSEITPDLTKYLFTKALDSKADIRISSKGQIDFSHVDSERITMQSLGLQYNNTYTGEEEARKVLKKIESGLKKIDYHELSSLKEKLIERFKNRTLSDYRTAEMILDRTETGLGWRIDAAKDIASIDSLRADDADVQKIWDNVVEFWKIYNQTVLKENPHAYTTAEITDLDDIIPRDDDAKYKHPADAERKFLEMTGITSVANYNYFFSMLPAMFTRYSFESGKDGDLGWDGWKTEREENIQLLEKLSRGWAWYEKDNIIQNQPEKFDPYRDRPYKGNDNPGFLFQSPEDGVINSYTFAGNHDKPRILHGLALNMNLFHGGLKSDEHQKIADRVLMSNISRYDALDSKAIAMGDRIDEAVDSIVNKKIIPPGLAMPLKKAVSHLAGGSYQGRFFEAEAFGTRPIETAVKSVMNEAEYMHSLEPDKYPEIDKHTRKKAEAALVQEIMTPAFDRFLSIYKMLITLPGSPADFAGDRIGVTGYESKAKNYHQQNRNVIPWEYLEEENQDKYQFIKNFYDEINKIAGLRKRPELSALNNGSSAAIPIALSYIDKEQDENGDEVEIVKTKPSEKLQMLMRYNDQGSIVLSLYSNAGAAAPYNKKMTRNEPAGEENHMKLIFNPEEASIKEGLNHGIRAGMHFKNANPEDTSEYITEKAEINGKECYYLKRIQAVPCGKGKIYRQMPFKLLPSDLNTMVLYCTEGPSANKPV